MSHYEAIHADVTQLLGADTSGHGMAHVERVRSLSLTMAREEGADLDVVEITALLHDVDDYKLFGKENADALTNATDILVRYSIAPKIAKHVLRIIPSMGYNNFLEGKRPTTLEGKIVSDADMCDAIGASGILRTYQYNQSKGRPFFDKNIAPLRHDVTADEYRASATDHAVQHFFDKLLLIPDILLTETGKQEGEKRVNIMIDFLESLFEEENAQAWQDRLTEFRSVSGR